jgi:hypothetical protein
VVSVLDGCVPGSKNSGRASQLASGMPAVRMDHHARMARYGQKKSTVPPPGALGSIVIGKRLRLASVSLMERISMNSLGLSELACAAVTQKQMGAPSDPPLNRRTGVGRVDPRPGDYADAFTKGNIAHLLASETTGALAPEVIRLLHALDKSTKDAQGHDSTQYGLGRASPQSFFPHHLAAVSCAIVRADALTIRNHAASLAVALAHGFAASSRPK